MYHLHMFITKGTWHKNLVLLQIKFQNIEMDKQYH